MCAINGFNFPDRNLIEKMNSATKHRGPDGTSFFIDENISLGHNLLAIMETPDNSLQPLVSANKNFVLAFNGEVYNYLSLRHDLQRHGDEFTTNSDTEVLFKGLIRYGSDFISKLDGMFAFAFYDRSKSKLILARDRLGMKPLYYFYADGKLIFSSEIRGIFTHDPDRVLDPHGLAIYLSFGYVPGQKTLLKNIFSVSPGQYVDFDLQNQDLSKYWFGFKKQNLSGHFEPEALRQDIALSVSEHTMGLRPFGLYLSGGLDSTIILHELIQQGTNKLRTYTTRFDVPDENFNEDAQIAQKLSKDYGLVHHELLVTEDNFINSIEQTIATMEEPRYNYSATTYWLMAQQASRDIVVVLSGSGGDELFMGYSKYLDSHKINQNQASDLDKTINRWLHLTKIIQLPHAAIAESSLLATNTDLIKYIQNNGGQQIEQTSSHVENSIASLDRLLWLADEEFLRTDKIAMHFGMEGRFPLVANRLIEYANKLSPEEKLYAGQSKYVLREAYQDRLPDFITKKRKTGWHSPVALWMGSRLYDLVRTVLTPEFYPATSNLFNFDFIVRNYLPSRKPITSVAVKQFWPIFSFQIWAKLFNVKV